MQRSAGEKTVLPTWASVQWKNTIDVAFWDCRMNPKPHMVSKESFPTTVCKQVLCYSDQRELVAGNVTSWCPAVLVQYLSAGKKSDRFGECQHETHSYLYIVNMSHGQY